MFNIHDWKVKSQQLKKLKADEADMRREICEEIIAGAPMDNGRVTIKTHADGYAIKAVQTLSFSIDVAALGAIWEHLTPEEQDCVVMKPTLNLTKYKQLTGASLLHEAVVSRLAMPTLQAELEEA
jgi:hypothetical protein